MASKAELQSRLEEINALIASGEESVRDSDGKSATYRSMDDLMRAKASIESQLGANNGKRRRHLARSVMVSRGL